MARAPRDLSPRHVHLAHRLTSADAATLVHGWFPPERVCVLPAAARRSVDRTLAGAGIDGGASYDGLIALTARHHGATLVTRDLRAVRTYEALDVRYEVL